MVNYLNRKKEENKKVCHYKFIRNKRCDYRYLNDGEVLNEDTISQFNTYMSEFNYMQLKIVINQNVELEEENGLNYDIQINDEKQLEQSEEEEDDFSKKNEEDSNANSQDIPDEQLQLFKEHSKNNTYKNILCAFQRHIEDLEDTTIISTYENLTEDKWTFDYIKIRVNQNLKKCGRFHLKMKNLLSSKNLKSVFIYFLKNSNSLWIEQSKIKDKEKLKESIDVLIQASQNKTYVETISYYKKSKRKY